MEEMVKTKIETMKPVESHFFLSLVSAQKISGLFLHLKYKNEFENREAGLEYNEHVLKPRFEESTEAVWRPKTAKSKSHSSLTDTGQGTCKLQSQPPSLLQKPNYVPVDQCTND